jgi:hypothetical protein
VRSKRSAKFYSRIPRCASRFVAGLGAPCSPRPMGCTSACALATYAVAESGGVPALQVCVPNPRSCPVQHKPILAQIAASASKIHSVSRLFSAPSTLLRKSAYLIENTSQMLISNPLYFNHLRTLFHSFPGSPLFAICSPKHTGGIPPSHPFGASAPLPADFSAPPRYQSEHSRLPYILVASNTAHPGAAARRNRVAEVKHVSA